MRWLFLTFDSYGSLQVSYKKELWFAAFVFEMKTSDTLGRSMSLFEEGQGGCSSESYESEHKEVNTCSSWSCPCPVFFFLVFFYPQSKLNLLILNAENCGSQERPCFKKVLLRVNYLITTSLFCSANRLIVLLSRDNKANFCKNNWLF